MKANEIKPGMIVLNKKTNMVGVVASVEEPVGYFRCEHDDRTAWYSVADAELYTGKCQPGEEYDASKDAAPPVTAKTKAAMP